MFVLDDDVRTIPEGRKRFSGIVCCSMILIKVLSIFQSIFRLHNYVFFASYHKKFQQVKYCQYNLQQPQGTACFLSAGLRFGHFDSILTQQQVQDNPWNILALEGRQNLQNLCLQEIHVWV